MKKRTRKILILSGIITSMVLLVYFVFDFNNISILQTSLFKSVARFFNIIFTGNIVLIAFFIFVENKNPSRTIAWLLVLFLIPWLGFVLYIVLGRNTFKRKKSKQKHLSDQQRSKDIAQYQSELFSEIDVFNNEKKLNNKLVNLLLKNSNAIFTVNNSLEILTNGQATFSSIIDAIKKAEHHIHLEYFIIKDDEIGRVIKNLLMDKAQAGVAVRVIYDSVGCWKLSQQYLTDLKEAGVEVFAFFPVIFPILSEDLNYRNHRKIIVIDGSVGFVGGLNIGDEYLGRSKKLGFWRDTHLRIEGEAVLSLQRTFLNDWAFVSQQSIPESREYQPVSQEYGSSIVQIVESGPDSDWFAILQAYFQMISSAEKRIWITTPYLVPQEGVMLGLKTAALSGVDVRIIIPDKADHFFVYWASQDNIEELLEAGVKIYQYKNGFIHSKIIIVDGICASVGTANLDYRSLEINFEVNAFIYDEQAINTLESDFSNDIADSQEIMLSVFRNRKWYYKVLEASGRLVSPLQ